MKHSIRIAGQTMRVTAVALSMLLWAGSPAMAQVSIGVSMPGVSIGINMPMYPELVRVPNYPVYYAPRLQTNFFFYDGMYWVYQRDNWYASSWYNGPWSMVGPQEVPLFVLRIPVRYYRNPPTYFVGWQTDAPPRWGEHWGNQWSQQRSGWDRWDRRSIPAPAPLPLYQRQYSGDRYPQFEQQQALQGRNYRYQPRDPVVRQYYQQVAPATVAPAQRTQQAAPAAVAPPQRTQQAAPAAVAPPQRTQQAAPTRAPDQPDRPAAQGRPQQPERPQPAAERGQPQAPGARAAAPAQEQAQKQGQGQGQGQGRADGKGKGKGKGQEQDRDPKDESGRQGKN